MVRPVGASEKVALELRVGPAVAPGVLGLEAGAGEAAKALESGRSVRITFAAGTYPMPLRIEAKGQGQLVLRVDGEGRARFTAGSVIEAGRVDAERLVFAGGFANALRLGARTGGGRFAGCAFLEGLSGLVVEGNSRLVLEDCLFAGNAVTQLVVAGAQAQIAVRRSVLGVYGMAPEALLVDAPMGRGVVAWEKCGAYHPDEKVVAKIGGRLLGAREWIAWAGGAIEWGKTRLDEARGKF
jgi:hypothetical protein